MSDIHPRWDNPHMLVRRTLCLLILLGPLLPSLAIAGHHRWDFTEVFSNSDGSIQFVELFSANTGESAVSGWTITSASTGEVFTFGSNLPGDSQNTWVLIATTGFAALPGAPTPDYVLPDGFFDVAGDTLTYAGGADTWVLGAVPTNGVDSLDRSSGTGANTPTNFAGVSGSVDASSAGAPAATSWGLALLGGGMLIAATSMIRTRMGRSAR